MADLTCEHCSKTFSNLSNKRYHQRTAKTCLSIQGKSPAIYVCRDCDQQFASKYTLARHEETCEKVNQLKKLLAVEIENKLLREENRRLHDSLDAISAKTTTVYKNCVINNINLVKELAPYTLTAQKIEQIVDEKFEARHLHLKKHGLAKFAVDNIIRSEDGKPQLICTNKAGRNFIYRDENGNVYRDADASEFSDQYLTALEKKGRKIIEEIPDTDNDAMMTSMTGITQIQDLKENPIPLAGELAKKLISKTPIIVAENQ